jgi:hypothetical protein
LRKDNRSVLTCRRSILAKLLPTVAPARPAVPDPAIHLNVRPTQFGGYQAQGLQELGADASRAGKVWGEIAADDSANTFQEEANKILHGDPNKIITLPDGTTTTDMGYMGLKGRAAMDQRQEYEGRLKKLFEKQQGQMLSFDQQRTFDNLTRRYRAVISSEMGRHANTQGNAYGVEVNKAGLKLKAEEIGADPENEEAFLHHTPTWWTSRPRRRSCGAPTGRRDVAGRQQRPRMAAAETRVMAIGVKDPRRALEMAEHYKGRAWAITTRRWQAISAPGPSRRTAATWPTGSRRASRRRRATMPWRWSGTSRGSRTKPIGT